VRFDGGHKRDPFITETLGGFVEWVPVCPELEAGMGVPRETVRLVGSPAEPRMVAERSGTDWTRKMEKYAEKRLKELATLNLSGYVVKKDSPTCGMERVRVYGAGGPPSRRGRGLFAQALMRGFPLLPVEEEGRLHDTALRENFIERIFAYHGWQGLFQGRKTLGALVDFHTRQKLLIFAHSEPHFRRLGRIVAEAKKRPLGSVVDEYGGLYMEALAVRSTIRKNTNVLQHIMGYFSKRLSPDERIELLEVIQDYHRGLVPLIVPLTLVRHYARKYQVDYIEKQAYLQPHPKELMLRNHSCPN
jgi:uncharacterized protein YbgA (DUF1722 family)/uncharacterized protein YbbK (DUF523 family)